MRRSRVQHCFFRNREGCLIEPTVTVVRLRVRRNRPEHYTMRLCQRHALYAKKGSSMTREVTVAGLLAYLDLEEHEVLITDQVFIRGADGNVVPLATIGKRTRGGGIVLSADMGARPALHRPFQDAAVSALSGQQDRG